MRTKRIRTNTLLMTTAALALFADATPVAAQSTAAVVVEGDPAPDGDGVIAFFVSNPMLNDAGQAVFTAVINGENGNYSSLFRTEPDGSGVVQIVRTGDVAPEGPGVFSGFSIHSLNNNGQVLFNGSLDGTTGGSADDYGLFLSEPGASGISQLVREGDGAPDGNGVFSVFYFGALNDVGQATFLATLAETSGGFADDAGIFRSETGTPELTRIVRKGDAAPDGNGVVIYISEFGHALNDAGQAAFEVAFDTTNKAGTNEFSILTGDGAALDQIVRTGEAAPDGNGVFAGFQNYSPPALNDAGQTAFLGFFTDTSGVGATDINGLVRSDPGAAGIDQVARGGDASPDGNGVFFAFGAPALNDHGQTLYLAGLGGTSGGTTDNFGIFRHDPGAPAPVEIVRAGDAVPNGDGVFSQNFYSPVVLNDAGQAAFKAKINHTSSGLPFERGMFFYDGEMGLLQIVRYGVPLHGSTVAGFHFDTDELRLDEFNMHGQFMYEFILADGREGFAVWTPPGCRGDVSPDDAVDPIDLMELLNAWGTSDFGAGAYLAEPKNVVDTFDLLELLANWGPCE